MFNGKISKNYFLLLIFGILAALTVILSAYSYTNLNKGSAKIEVIPESYDFGDIPYEKVEHIFTVRNNGNAPLEIKGVSTSCGCTKAAIESEKIQPGETTSLYVSYDPNIMGGDANGNVFRVVYIKSNDPLQSEIEIKISASLKV